MITAILQFVNSSSVLVRNGKVIPANTRWRSLGPHHGADPAGGHCLFAVDADEGSTITTLAAAMDVEGENADHAFATADAGLGLSGALLDISTNATTSLCSGAFIMSWSRSPTTSP